ncbi:cyclin-J-like protein [Cylas formicarius]|uniref:cyclin-J-like protein n=1 Tax=Cylas formicarius TaxID=197179 RepID=UPI002958ADB3|nr:cyclin-J-like protein [Cylas formicarius]
MDDLMNVSSMFYPQNGYGENLNEYTECFKQVIKERENVRIPFYHQSPQLAYRPYLIEYLRRLCMDKKFSHCCLHLAVYILDTFMDCHNVEPGKILLLANVCLLLAAKFEENIGKIPKISEINAAVFYRYSLREYRNLEVMVLQYFSWYIMFPTVAHYAHYYMQLATADEEESSLHNVNQKAVLTQRFQHFVTNYLNQIIDNIHYMQDFKPSKLAAAVIAASRLHMGLKVWTPQLERMTDYTIQDVNDLLLTIMINRFFNKINNSLPSNRLCTSRQNYCTRCSVMSCPKCNFLQKINY